MTFEENIPIGSIQTSLDKNQSEVRGNASPHVTEMDDSSELELADKVGLPIYKAHWQLFVPTFVILTFYGLGLILLSIAGMTDTSLFRLFSLVLGVGVPLLSAHAFLRYQTVRLRFTETALRIHKGWPKNQPIEVPYALIDDIKVKRGLAGRLFGGGTVVLSLTTDTVIAVSDLRSCVEIQSQFRRMAKQE